MYLNARYTFPDHDPAPLPMGCFAVGGKIEFSFNQSRTVVCFGDGKSESIPVGRPRAHIPKFRQILRCREEVRTLRPQEIRAASNAFVFRAIWLSKPQQDIGIHEVRRA
jgi:hypothetical protein